MRIVYYYQIIIVLSIILAAFVSICAQTKQTYSLNFDAEKFSLETANVNGKTVRFRAYKNIVYVRFPVDTKYQSQNFYAPVEYFEEKTVGGFNKNSAPIFFPNNVGGYMPAEPGQAGTDQRSGAPNATLIALSKGFVVASPGARGRTLIDADKKYYGKAPAAIVDLKAAVRYLRFNDKTMPGNAEKIVSNGTSAGGALSALVGATGNSSDYEPYLKALGAANARDDVYAVSAYCPITNLDHADAAYEWHFNEARDYKKMLISRTADGQIERKQIAGTLTAEEIAVSDRLKKLFPPYLNGIKLKTGAGKLLALSANGDGSFKDYVSSLVSKSAQKALDQGKDLSGMNWLTVKDKKVTAVDFDGFVQYTQRMKQPPAFDALDLTSGENDLFGSENVKAKHFTKFGLENSQGAGAMTEGKIIKMMNPMNYIGTGEAKTARHWRIRHGTIDRDTSMAIPIILAARLQNKGYDVNIELPWEQGHGGDYDLNELFDWIEEVSR